MQEIILRDQNKNFPKSFNKEETNQVVPKEYILSPYGGRWLITQPIGSKATNVKKNNCIDN